MKKHLTLLVFASLSAFALYADPGARLAHAAAGDIYNLGTLGGTVSARLRHQRRRAGRRRRRFTAGDAVHAFRYDGTPGSGGVMHDLGTLPAIMSSAGYGINASGQVAGDGPVAAATASPSTPSATTARPARAASCATSARSAGTGAAATPSTTPGRSPASRKRRGTSRYTPSATRHARQRAASCATSAPSAGRTASAPASTTPGRSRARRRRWLPSRHTPSATTARPAAAASCATSAPSAGRTATAYAINDSGQVAGSSDTLAGFTTHAFRYDGTPGSGRRHGRPGHPRRAEQRSLRASTTPASSSESPSRAETGTIAPALWRPDLTVVDLDAWLDAINPTVGAYWSLSEARGINDAGLITGWGRYDDGPGGLSDGSEIAFILDASSLVATLAGDYSGNGTVGPEDYDVWKTNFGSTVNLAADGNGNHIIDAADYTVWRNNLGATIGSGSGAALPSAESLSAAVPEPSSIASLLLATANLLVIARRPSAAKNRC